MMEARDVPCMPAKLRVNQWQLHSQIPLHVSSHVNLCGSVTFPDHSEVCQAMNVNCISE